MTEDRVAVPQDDIMRLVGGHPLLDGQTVILTGAAGGIGRCVATALSCAHARVAVTDLDASGLETVADGLRAQDAEFVSRAVDASDPAQFHAFYEAVGQELGLVTGLVNCAGAWGVTGFSNLTVSDMADMFMANLATAFVACKAVLPAMVAARSGAIVNFASTAGEYGSISPAAHYAAAKGAVIAFTKSLAREVGAHNVRVNTISPGPTDTEALGAVTPEQKIAVGARTLFGRLGRPEEIAASCVYLLSPLSSFVTGHVLRVNGGSLL